MDQHYIPRFYLQGFCDPEPPPPPRDTPFLWVCGKKDRRWRKRSPKKVATHPDFYDFTDQWGNRQTLLENSLQIVENGAAPIFQKKIPNCELFTPEDREYFAGFLATMMARTPTKLAQLAKVHAEMGRHRLRVRLRNWSRHPEEWLAFVNEFNAAHPPERQLDAAQDPTMLDPDPDRFDVFVEPREMIPAALHAAFRSIPGILKMGWCFFRSESPNYFVTSDNPFVAANPETGLLDSGLRDPGTEITLPLNRTQFFVGSWKLAGTLWRLATPKFVEEMNRRTVARAETLFAPKRVFPGSEMLASALQRG